MWINGRTYAYGLLIALAAMALTLALRGAFSKPAADESAAAEPRQGEAPLLPEAPAAPSPASGVEPEGSAPPSPSADPQALTQEIVQRLEQAQRSGGAVDPTAATLVNPAFNRLLTEQIDAAQQQLLTAHSGLTGSAQGETIALALQLLEATRDRLAAPDPTDPAAAAALDQHISVALESAQLQLDHLRGSIQGMPNAAALIDELNQRQQQLDLARATHANRPVATGSPSMRSDADIARMLQDGRQALERARAKAVGRPDAEALLRQIDAAQTQLDAAEARYRQGQTGPAR